MLAKATIALLEAEPSGADVFRAVKGFKTLVPPRKRGIPEHESEFWNPSGHDESRDEVAERTASKPDT